jgi:uncharacterized membrane protein
MNLRLYIICIAAVLALSGPALANSTATVHGAVYGWDTFKPLENAVVEVNSTPSQSMVAKYGLYSFDLIPGDYNITASYYQNSSVTYSASEIIQIKDQGKYVRDLLLLPVYSEELMDDSELNGFSEDQNGTAESSSSNTTNSLTDASTGQMESKGNSSSTNSADQSGIGPINMNNLLITLLLILLLAAGYRVSGRDKKIEKTQPQKRAHRVSGTGAAEKGHTTGDFFNPVKVPELSVEVHDERVEVPHESLEPEIKRESQVQESQVQESQVQESQVQEYRVKPFETSSSTESVKEPVREPVEESLQNPIKESIKEPANEQVKPAVTELSPEIPEEKVPEEFAETKADSQENEIELTESEPQKEKQGIPYEEVEDQSLESPETDVHASRKKLPLPADLQEVMDIIRGQGGRITQKDLRSKLKYSEGKVSLMLADLERRELVEKFKRGRGNVVILRDEER